MQAHDILLRISRPPYPEYIGLRPTITDANLLAAVAAVLYNPITIATAVVAANPTPPLSPPRPKIAVLTTIGFIIQSG